MNTNGHMFHIPPFLTHIFLGSEVDKPSKIMIKTMSIEEYIELNIQNIEVPKINDPII